MTLSLGNLLAAKLSTALISTDRRQIAALRMKKILVIEDEAQNREMFIEFLEAEGFEVMSAENGVALNRSNPVSIGYKRPVIRL